MRWFHTGGIYAALSDSTPEVVIEAVKVAKKHGTIVSYDLNYRPSLWDSIGGQAKAQEVNREIAKYVDVMIGNEEDFTACLGFEVEGVDENISNIEIDAFKNMINTAVAAFPNFKVTATTLRAVKSATVNDWGAICWADGNFYEATNRKEMEIFDRVGGGDSFASGLIYGFIATGDPAQAVEYGAAHGALAMTTPGDTSMATKGEVERLRAAAARAFSAKPARVRRLRWSAWRLRRVHGGESILGCDDAGRGAALDRFDEVRDLAGSHRRHLA